MSKGQAELFFVREDIKRFHSCLSSASTEIRSYASISAGNTLLIFFRTSSCSSTSVKSDHPQQEWSRFCWKAIDRIQGELTFDCDCSCWVVISSSLRWRLYPNVTFQLDHQMRSTSLCRKALQHRWPSFQCLATRLYRPYLVCLAGTNTFDRCQEKRFTVFVSTHQFYTHTRSLHHHTSFVFSRVKRA